MIQNVIIASVIGYLLGSIPFALVIGKVFFNTDVRNFGSGNLGGSNTGRILGKKAGISVIVLDAMKVVLAVAIPVLVFNDEVASVWAGVFACAGHCYPIFAKFKGGKAVASLFGFLLAIAIFTYQEPFVFVIPLTILLVVLRISKMISLASMIAVVCSSIYIIVIVKEPMTIVASLLLCTLVIYRHRANIQRIIQGSETKVTLFDKK